MLQRSSGLCGAVQDWPLFGPCAKQGPSRGRTGAKQGPSRGLCGAMRGEKGGFAAITDAQGC